MTNPTTPEARPEWEPVACQFRLKEQDAVWTGTCEKETLTKVMAGKFLSGVFESELLYGPAVHTEMLRAQEEARVLREALELVEPHLDMLVDYSATATECPLNLVPEKVRAALKGTP